MNFAHTGHVHAPQWPAWAIACLVAAAVIGVGAIVWFFAAEARDRRRQAAARKPAKQDALRRESARRKAIFGLLLVLALGAGGAGLAGRPPANTARSFADAPSPTSVDSKGDYPLDFVVTQASGTFEAEVRNRTGFVVWVECQIGPYDAGGDLLTSRTYEATTETGEKTTSELYTNGYLLEPKGSQQFGADVTVTGPVERWEGTCDARRIPDDLREKLTEEALEALAPGSR